VPEGLKNVQLIRCSKNNPSDTFIIAEQKAWLEHWLTMQGWDYTIVHNADDFAREFYTGHYVQYALLSNRVTLSNDVQQALADAVAQGEGLLIGGAFNRRNNHLEKQLGIGIAGREQQADGVSIAAHLLSDLAPAFTFNPPHKLDIDRCEADTVATYFGVKKGNGGKTHSACPADVDKQAALLGFDYQQGAAVFAGFDVLDEATAAAADDSVYAQILGWALQRTQPEALDRHTALPVQMQVINSGLAVELRVTVGTLPEQSVVRASSWVDEGQNLWSVTQALETNATWALPLLYVLGDATLQILIETRLPNGEWTTYQQDDVVVGDLP